MRIDLLISLSIMAGYLLWPLAIGSLLLFVIFVARNRRWNQPTLGALLLVIPGMYAGVYFLGLMFGGNLAYSSGAFYGLAGEILGYLFGWSLFALAQSGATKPRHYNPAAVWFMGLFSVIASGCYGYYRYEAYLRQIIWSDKTTPQELTAVGHNFLTRHSNFIANELARNPRAPIEALLALQGSRMWKEVSVHYLAMRPDTPIDLLEQFSRDLSDVQTHRGLAQNPKMTADIAERLANDNDVDVRMSLIQNPATPTGVLERIKRDSPVLASSIDDILKRRQLAMLPSRPTLLNFASLIGMSLDEFEKAYRRALATNHLQPDSRFMEFIRYVRKSGGFAELKSDQISVIHPWISAFDSTWQNGRLVQFGIHLNKPMKDEKEFRQAFSLPKETSIKLYSNKHGTAAVIQ